MKEERAAHGAADAKDVNGGGGAAADAARVGRLIAAVALEVGAGGTVQRTAGGGGIEKARGAAAARAVEHAGGAVQVDGQRTDVASPAVVADAGLGLTDTVAAAALHRHVSNLSDSFTVVPAARPFYRHDAMFQCEHVLPLSR